MLAWIRITIINIKFTITTLEALGAAALVGANHVFAGCSILTRVCQTFICLNLAVAAIVAIRADTFMAVSSVMAESSILTKSIPCYTIQACCCFTWYTTHITHLASPALWAVALKACTSLRTSSTIFTWRISTPVNNLFTFASSPACWAVACVETILVYTATTISTWFLVAG